MSIEQWGGVVIAICFIALGFIAKGLSFEFDFDEPEKNSLSGYIPRWFFIGVGAIIFLISIVRVG